MGIETIALAGAVLGGVGAVGQAYYTSQAAGASRRAERLREQQMRLDAMRRRRETIRQMLVTQGLANARAAAQGAFGEGSSIVGGAFGQISGEGGRQLNYTDQSETIGAGIFAANRDVASAQGMASLFNGAGQLGGTILSNSASIYNIGTTLFGGTASSAGGSVVPPVANPWMPTVTATPQPSYAAVNVPIARVYNNAIPFYGQGGNPY